MTNVMIKTTARLNLGISILYIPPRSAPPSLMAFKEPFSTDVYIAILVIFIFAAFIIYFLARLSFTQLVKSLCCNFVII